MNRFYTVDIEKYYNASCLYALKNVYRIKIYVSIIKININYDLTII